MAKKKVPLVSIFFLGCLTFYFSPLIKAHADSYQLLYQKNGTVDFGYLSYSVSGAGDVNGDGKGDFIVGAPFLSPGGNGSAGSAFVYSGADGSVLWQKDGAFDLHFLGWSVGGAGDVDGDGKADFIIGAPDVDSVGSILVYSGATGGLLYKMDGDSNAWLGYSVAGAGDVNGDGRYDFIAGAPYANPNGDSSAGSVFVYSGANGSLLWEKHDTTDYVNFGFCVAGAGDVNGDGKADFMAGTPFTAAGGSAYVYSGADGTLLYQKDAAVAGDQFGTSVAGAGDVNGDGRADFMVGAPTTMPGGADVIGSAYVYSGADGSLLYEKDGIDPLDDFGFSVAGAGDVDGDGKGDFLVGARYTDSSGITDVGSAFLYSGADGSLLFQKNGAGQDDHLGYAVAGAGDINGDGRADFIIGAEAADYLGVTDAGSAYVFGMVGTDAPTVKEIRPLQFELSQNYPNPFNPTTNIRYVLPRQEKVSVEVFNILGERVRVLVNEEQTAGEHHAVLDGRDEKGGSLSSGIYFYRLNCRDFSETKKMLLIK